MAACLLLRLGAVADADAAIAMVRARRRQRKGGSIAVEKVVQEEWVHVYALLLGKGGDGERRYDVNPGDASGADAAVAAFGDDLYVPTTALGNNKR